MRSRAARVARAAILGLVAAISLAGCHQGVGPGDSEGCYVGEDLYQRIAAGSRTIDFAASGRFLFDRVYVFGGYTAQSDVDKKLGFHWADFGKTGLDIGSEYDYLVLFVSGGKVVHWYVDSTGRINYDPIVGDYDSAHTRFRAVKESGASGIVSLEK